MDVEGFEGLEGHLDVDVGDISMRVECVPVLGEVGYVFFCRGFAQSRSRGEDLYFPL